MRAASAAATVDGHLEHAPLEREHQQLGDQKTASGDEHRAAQGAGQRDAAARAAAGKAAKGRQARGNAERRGEPGYTTGDDPSDDAGDDQPADVAPVQAPSAVKDPRDVHLTPPCGLAPQTARCPKTTRSPARPS